ncbi:hypothetical protein EMCRGX_G027353 [Ephydatia muelleri]
MKKSAVDVAVGLVKRVFPYLGLPKILQSDNGREFVNEIVKEVVRSWPGEVVIINGRPRHSQSQGLVEKGNHLVEMQIQSMKNEWKESGDVPWSDWLARIQYNLNTQVCRTLKKSPYEVVFGQPPRTTPFAELPKGKNPCIMEEDVADLIATGDDENIASPHSSPHKLPPSRSPLSSPEVLSPVSSLQFESSPSALPSSPLCHQSPAQSPNSDIQVSATAQMEAKGSTVPEPNSLLHSTPPSKISLSASSSDHVLSPPSQSSVSNHSNSAVMSDPKVTIPLAKLTTSTRHLKIREDADNEYRKNAERMKIQYAKRKRHQIKTYSAGDSVTVRIPRNERSSTDMPRLLCYILEAKNDQYRLHADSSKLPTLSLSEAARTKKDQLKCNCTKGCKNRHCPCKGSGVYCTSHCHPKHACTNKECHETDDGVEECTVTGADCDDKMKVKKRKPIKNAKHKSVAAMITSVQIVSRGGTCAKSGQAIARMPDRLLRQCVDVFKAAGKNFSAIEIHCSLPANNRLQEMHWLLGRLVSSQRPLLHWYGFPTDHFSTASYGLSD